MVSYWSEKNNWEKSSYIFLKSSNKVEKDDRRDSRNNNARYKRNI